MPDTEAYDKSVHLGIDDIAIDNPSSPSFVRVRITQSKTDPFRRGVNLFLGRTRTDLCPVAEILSYIVVRGVGLGPMFRFADGCPLTRSRFVAQVRAALTTAGIEEGSYCSHSFCIGAATTAAARGIEDSVIKTLGRWELICNTCGSLGWVHRVRSCAVCLVVISREPHYYCINNVGLMWGEGPRGPVLGLGWGGILPAQRSSPLINLVGGGAPCPSTTAKC